MKKVNVIVKEKTLLELAEPADKGDLIDLKEVVQVDTTYLDMLIESGKEKAYESKLEEVKKRIQAEDEQKIQKLNDNIESLKQQHLADLRIKEQDIDKKYSDQINQLNSKITELTQLKSHELDNLKNEKQQEINSLNHKIENLVQENKNALDNKEHEVEKKYSEIISGLKEELRVLKETQKSEVDKINSKNDADKSKLQQEEQQKYSKLEQEYKLLQSQFESKLEQLKTELTNKYEREIETVKVDTKLELSKKDNLLQQKDSDFELEKVNIIAKEKEKYEAIIREKEDKINQLQHAKASLNVKQTGEDLEAWCDNEVSSYMQNGLFNCTWEKDNKVIKEEGEIKGSKADFIFKVYANEEHKPEELLASVCMDMKDENPDSVNKKSNSDYYSQLEKNREKKKCKYALLVSNLELDKPNVSPIFKVREYENMYVVRPAYLMTFLNMITSLTTRFSQLIMNHDSEELSLKGKLDLIEEFDSIKKSYLDNQLTLLENAIEEITEDTEKIRSISMKIDAQCDKITNSYINKIQSKLNTFELKLNKQVVKKLKDENE